VTIGPRGRGGSVAAAAVFFVVLVLILQCRYGYQAGMNDHLVLSLQGLQWGHPGWLVNDWFIKAAPQPHILFDVVTRAGASTGWLTGVYLAWWLMGLVVGGIATAVLARAWTPRHPVLASAAVAALIGLGPEVVLGSTTPALPTALPHELGGFLAYLSAALLLTRRPRIAAVVIVVTAAVHVQVGALAAVVGVLAVLAVAALERTWWWSVLAGCVVAVGIVVTVLRLRPVASDGDDFVQICQEVIPYHCDATTWSAGQLGSGFAVVLAALLTVAYVVRTESPGVGCWMATVVAPAVGLTAGVLANRYGVPVLGRLAQSVNIFRLAVLLVPFGAWGLVAGFVRLTGWRRLAWLVPAAAAGYGWFVPVDGSTALPNAPAWGGAVLGLGALGVLLRALPRRAGATTTAVAGVAALAVLVVGAIDLEVLRWRPVNVTFVPASSDRAMGRMIAAHVPVGEELLVPPTLGVVRLVSGRSVVVDCKAVPYGGAAWREYRDRLEALGGRGSCFRGGHPFLLVTPEGLTRTALRYGARYLLLSDGDPRFGAIERLGWRVLAAPSRSEGNMWLLAAPGALDAGFFLQPLSLPPAVGGQEAGASEGRTATRGRRGGPSR
jgi:hypothetical protein